jgi:nitric oxide reductase NorQ protein
VTLDQRTGAAAASQDAGGRRRENLDVLEEASALADFRIAEEPYYRVVGDEISLYEAAYRTRMPVMLKGPTGCGKTRFVEHMAWRLGRPLVTVACHEDMTGADLAGRWLLDAEGTIWRDGPLTLAVRHGAICYLDEIVEARQDTTVVIHPLTDDRRVLPLERRGELIHAHPDFQLVISYNPGYQSVVKDLKESTKQRFAAIDFDYPAAPVEAEIVANEAGIDVDSAALLVRIAERSRHLKGQGLDEGASTRMLINAGRLMAQGVALDPACEATLIVPLTDDIEMRKALRDLVAASTP